MAVDILNTKQRIGFLRQVAGWGTPIAASGNFQTLNYDKGVTIAEPDVQIDELNFTSQYGIHKEVERTLVDSIGGSPSINFSGLANNDLIAAHFAAALQSVTEIATTPFKKVISCAGLTAPVDFAIGDGTTNAGGYTWTIAMDSITGSDGVLLTNAILDEFDFSVDCNARGIARLPKISGTWKGVALAVDQNLSGTWVARPTTGFYNGGHSGDNTWDLPAIGLTLGATECSGLFLRNFSIHISNGLMVRERTVGGVPSQFEIKPKISITVRIGYNATSYKALSSYAAGSNVYFKVQNGASVAPTVGGLKITAPYGILTSNPTIFDGEYRAIEVKFDARSTAGGTPIEVEVTDAVDGNYPAPA